MSRRMLATALMVFSAPLLPAHTSPDAPPPPPRDTIFVPDGFFTGNDYRNRLPAQKQDYVTGVFDGLMGAPLLRADGRLVLALKECVKGMNNEQVTAIVDKFVTEHPELWHHPMQEITFHTFVSTCPGFAAAYRAHSRRQKPSR